MTAGCKCVKHGEPTNKQRKHIIRVHVSPCRAGIQWPQAADFGTTLKDYDVAWFFWEKSAVLIWLNKLLYEAYKLIDIEDRLEYRVFQVYSFSRSSLHDQPRIPSQPSAKPWLFWRREAVVRFLKVRWRGWGSCQEQPSSRPAALLQIAQLDRLRERGQVDWGGGIQGWEDFSFFWEDQTMQVYVDLSILRAVQWHHFSDFRRSKHCRGIVQNGAFTIWNLAGISSNVQAYSVKLTFQPLQFG